MDLLGISSTSHEQQLTIVLSSSHNHPDPLNSEPNSPVASVHLIVTSVQGLSTRPSKLDGRTAMVRWLTTFQQATDGAYFVAVSPGSCRLCFYPQPVPVARLSHTSPRDLFANGSRPR